MTHLHGMTNVLAIGEGDEAGAMGTRVLYA